MSAAITAAAVGAAGAVAGGVMASKGAKKAGQAQQQGIDEATALQREMWQQQRKDQAPWLQGGQTGLNALMYGLGLGGRLPGETFGGGMAETWDPESVLGPRPVDPEGSRQWDINAAAGQKQFQQNRLLGQAQLEKNLAAMTPEQRANYEQQRKAGGLMAGGLMATGPEYKQFSMEDFQKDPGYKFRLRQGLKALDRTASARGGLLSGGALKAAEGYGQEMGSQEYGNAFNRNQIEQTNLYNRFQTGQTNQYNRLASLAGVGQQTAQQLGQAGQQYAQNAGGLMQAGGENQANALLAGANARGSMYQGIGNAFGGGMQSLGGMFGGGGSNQNVDPWGRRWG
jgi:hypothetical protein